MFGLNVRPPLGIGFPNLPKPHCLGQGIRKIKNLDQDYIETSLWAFKC